MNKIQLEKLIIQSKKSAPLIAHLPTKTKNKVLVEMAKTLRKNFKKILLANSYDIKFAEKKGLSCAFIDRLLLNKKRIEEMAKALENVARLPDPVGVLVSSWKRPNGLKISKMRIPLGVIGIVYEARPNVTVDAAGLCFKSGNVVVLRGGSEAFHSNQTLVALLQKVLIKNKLPVSAITFIPTPERKILIDMLQLSHLIDLIIPRGGEGLMRFMEKHSKIPVIKHDKGVCTIFVDESALISKAIRIIENAKVQRPGVCNAVENILVHQKIAKKFLPLLKSIFAKQKVELRGDSLACKIIPGIKKATEKDWSTEYLDLILSVHVVKNIAEAISFIRKYGSLHTEAILTSSKKNADLFITGLDSSCILVNASTRFNDGGQLGLGAEVGISTTKLHAFGPMGLNELTTTKFVVRGNGQVRK
ncbi:MAG: glutamate-5-semialdehyde dehydrogenase [Deltaproteobacteria bacterium RIFCSPLOWO2_12_FULL_40_28]|nr:MAG: glutamate-5-semialdehyde dehydrogenase [Deltaproteobacteria bacterium RIFCSPHIGHO2_02_FULL_40_28]OGQ20681.1 MAG: glutamate-5-semialdehyde dehydrogenase [Deltaproteobacteria bacterium RIFCSPHIGHO2_12_FULL_40_32]OGQ38916.1 MAG: glutamate-5-semialdehyde dehydrogenase [Deltaproteobacteria bacterium RIFCSPLOWO2_02_FULL_40_36]OGQ55276.1 MAG: glutamate-5-semialdehyde dehydrogenase [Deltaproteobacteria bacterium RIFCSPLOWO2_12_FULL_40_28]